MRPCSAFFACMLPKAACWQMWVGITFLRQFVRNTKADTSGHPRQLGGTRSAAHAPCSRTFDFLVSCYVARCRHAFCRAEATLLPRGQRQAGPSTAPLHVPQLQLHACHASRRPPCSDGMSASRAQEAHTDQCRDGRAARPAHTPARRIAFTRHRGLRPHLAASVNCYGCCSPPGFFALLARHAC